MSLSRAKTPCIGVCSTTFGDTVCRGCKRFLHEIVDWNRYTEEQKTLVWKRLDQLLQTVVQNYVEILDADKLQRMLTFQNIRQQPQLSPYGWLPELFKAAGNRQLSWADYGLLMLKAEDGADPQALYEQISSDVHTLAQAHYDRCHRLPHARLVELLALTAPQEEVS